MLTVRSGADKAVSGGALDVLLVAIQKCDLNPAVEEWLHHNRLVVALTAQVRECRTRQCSTEWVAALLCATIKCILAGIAMDPSSPSDLLADFIGPANGLECIRSTLDWLCSVTPQCPEVCF